MKIISDIDLTILDSEQFFHDSSEDNPAIMARQNSTEFQAGLLAVPPYSWVRDWKSRFAAASSMTFISGRGEHLREVTRQWIEREFTLTSEKLILVGYRDYQQYINDKISNSIAELLVMDANRSKDEVIHFFDDNVPTLEEILVAASQLKRVVVHRVFKGGMLKTIYLNDAGNVVVNA